VRSTWGIGGPEAVGLSEEVSDMTGQRSGAGTEWSGLCQGDRILCRGWKRWGKLKVSH
jgi:hypothetical protein